MKEAHKTEDLEKLDPAMEALNQAWQAASAEIYAAQQEAGGGDPGAGQDPGAGGGDAKGSSEDEVTDVEFEEVDDKA